MPRARRSGTAIKLDVLIVGGGLQGLVLLDELAAGGRSCALVSSSDLGHGQTLHSHGLLNTGFGFAGPGLRETRDRLVIPFLHARGIPPYGEWFLISPDEVEVGQGVSPGDLPVGLDAGGAAVRRLPELNFPKRALVEVLARDHLDRVVRGTVTELSGTGGIETVEVRPPESERSLLFAPAVLIAATGTGTKRFAGSLVGLTGQLSQIRHRLVHMICVKGPAGVLPEASVLSTARGFNLVAHSNGSSVTWYSTPFRDTDPSFDDVPDDAHAEVDPRVVADGLHRLDTLFPAIATRPEVRFAAYAGYRQDVGEVAGTPLCERLEGSANVVIALPSFAVNAWSNAKVAAEIVNAMVPRRSPQPDIPGAGVGVRVAPLREQQADVHWSTWKQIADRPPAWLGH